MQDKYNIGLLTVNIEFIWLGAKRGERLAKSSSFTPCQINSIFTVNRPILYIYITNLVCYKYFHWFFNPECQHIFGKQTGIHFVYFSPQKRLKHGRQNITLHWINGIIRNNKCILTKLNAVFILKTAAWTKKYYNG